MIEFVVRFAFDILAFTSVMVLIVLGLGVIASMMGIFNFAHGELVLLGRFRGRVCFAAELDREPPPIASMASSKAPRTTW